MLIFWYKLAKLHDKQTVSYLNAIEVHYIMVKGMPEKAKKEEDKEEDVPVSKHVKKELSIVYTTTFEFTFPNEKRLDYITSVLEELIDASVLEGEEEEVVSEVIQALRSAKRVSK